MKLYFHPYVDHRKWSLDTFWASILLQTGPAARDGLNLIWIGPPTWLGRPCLTPKVVAKEEDVLGHLLCVLNFLGGVLQLRAGSQV
jgi:hypothetical protein